MTDSELKEFARKTLEAVEGLFRENAALRALLMGYPPYHSMQTLERDIQKLANDPDGKQLIQRVFAPLYAQVEAATEDRVVLELLSKIPNTGKIN